MPDAGPRARVGAAALACALTAATGLLLPLVAERHTRPLLLDFGPNDADRVSGFRAEWERDRATRFHWTTAQAAVTLPARLEGPGHVLRMRMRRHFLDPAHVRLRVEEQTIAAFDFASDPNVSYPVLEFPLPPLQGRQPFELAIDAPSDAGRPLGLALDWMEIRREGPGARARLLTRTRLTLAGGALLACVLVLAAGGAPWGAGIAGSAFAICASLGVAADMVAAERILRLGLPSLACCGLVCLGAVLMPPVRRLLGLDSGAARGAAVALVLFAVAVRLALVLHPQFYYPDVKVHALFAWQLARRGIVAFLREFTANQFRYSLGLQMESGHWYAFPYPPAFYILAQPWIAAGYAPETAVALLAACVNGLEVLAILALARALRLSSAVGLAAAGAASLLPIFLARLCLAYFPALVGHAVDAVALVFVVLMIRSADPLRRALLLAVLVALALLAYTQAILNFAAVLGLFLLLDVAADRSTTGRRRQVAILAGGALGAVLALGVFYARYVPVFLDMRAGVPQAEESIVLDKMAHTRVDPDEPVEPEVDPYTGPNVDVIRGVRKAGWRLWVFYGPWTIAIAAGLVLLIRSQPGATRRLVIAWIATYFVLNLASGGLPGPNLVRYNKDLEILAPLACVALGMLGIKIGQRSRGAGWAYAALYAVFGLTRAAGYLTSTFSLER